MNKGEYTEGEEATKNFEEGMKTLFKAPKAKVAKVGKKLNSRPSQKKQPKRADED
jgi:hypothetical protein